MMVCWEKAGDVAIVVMNDAKNSNNPEFNAALLDVLDRVEKDEFVTSVVLSSSGEKNWSQGIDVQWLMENLGNNEHQAVRDLLYSNNRICERLLFFPVPVIAAIGGHCFGQGSVMACACDFRFMRADRGYFCFPEMDIGGAFTPGALAVVKKAIPASLYDDLILSARKATAPELEAHGVVLKACENNEELMENVLSFAREFSKKRQTFSAIKKKMHKAIVETMQREDPEFIEPLNIMT